MKGSITVFLALSLSVLTGFVMLLTGAAVRNAEKIRLEGAVDLGMNSVLGEFHTGLHDRYGLLYVDLSYGGREPSLENPESRLEFYIRKNIEEEEKGPWGEVTLDSVRVNRVKSAAFGEGNAMKYQAVCYMQDSGCEGTYHGDALFVVQQLEGKDAMAEWSALMSRIAEMELPQILNEKGQWEEVPLDNPADAIYALAGNDLLYLAGIDGSKIGVGRIQTGCYASERKLQNIEYGEERDADTELFVSYLFDKMGNYGRTREESFLQYQLEYIAMGKYSDYENLQAVTEKLLQWCFARNVTYAMEALYGEALEMADGLQAVALKESFREPVAESILYALAYLESISEVRCLMSGGGIVVTKEAFYTGPEQILTVDVLQIPSANEGYYYEDYLFAVIMLLPEKNRNLRSMDIMEMDIRMLSNNPLFSMDFCIERLEAEAKAGSYCLKRTYGYY